MLSLVSLEEGDSDTSLSPRRYGAKAMRESSEKAPTCKPGREFSPGTSPAGPLTSSLQNCDNIYVCCLSHPDWYFVMAAHNN